MGIKSGDFEFRLGKPVEYKFEGKTETAETVTLREPGMEHIKYYSRLKQMMTRSQLELVQQAETLSKMQQAIGEVVKPINDVVEEIEDTFEENYKGFMYGLESAEKVDLGQFMSTFEKMVCTRAKRTICMVDNRVAMTNVIWSNLHPEDAIEMAVRWCVFFGTPSQEGQKITLDQPLESPTEPTVV